VKHIAYSSALLNDESRQAPRSDQSISLAYLVGHYPGVSLTFILREVLLLGELGVIVRTASVNPPQPSQDGFTAVEERERQRTFYIKGRGLARIAGDHVTCLLTRPLPYLRGLAFACKLAGLNPRDLVHHLLYFAEAVVVGQWMRRENLAHIHVHFANAASTVALLASVIFPIQYSITVHGPTEFYNVEYYRLTQKIAGAAFICCIGQFCRSQLMKASPTQQWSKFHISPLGVDADVFQPSATPSGDPFRILCVGRLVPEKGQAILLSAAAELLNRGQHIHLDFVGDGPDRRLLESEARRLGIERAVTFHGSMNQEALRSLWNVANVFVLPSFAEGIPVALMEAMAMEIPCISTYIAGIPELIESGTDGLLFPPSDANLLANAITMLIEDPEFRLRLGRAGRQKVISHYNLQTNVERLASIFKEQCVSRPSGFVNE
jgi:glycosyltransferase involved in cell wall biosynthesis